MTGPQLETARLILRPPVEGDLDDWAALDADERVTTWIGGPQDRAASWRGLATVAGMWALRGCGLFSVIEKESGAWVGRAGPWMPEGALGTEIGWAFAGAAHGRGYATEAAGAAMDWGVRDAGMGRGHPRHRRRKYGFHRRGAAPWLLLAESGR